MGFDTHMIAGSRACSTSTRLTHSTITNQTSPHFAEALRLHRSRKDYYNAWIAGEMVFSQLTIGRMRAVG
jgi:hypothetical protein